MQLNLEDCGNNTVVIKVKRKRKHTLQTSVFKPEFLAVRVGPKQGCGHPCVISVIDITCSSLVSSSSPGLFHFTSHELFDRIFSFFLLFLTFYIKHATDVFLREVAFLADSLLFLLELRCCSLLISRRKERGSKMSTTTIQRPPFSAFDWLTSLLVLRSTFLLVIELS